MLAMQSRCNAGATLELDEMKASYLATATDRVATREQRTVDTAKCTAQVLIVLVHSVVTHDCNFFALR